MSFARPLARVRQLVRLASLGVRLAGVGALAASTACILGGRGSEVDVGTRAAAQIEEQVGLVDAPELAQYVEAIGRRLAAKSERADLDYTFDLLDVPEPNAFALPGGFIYVSRGLLVLLNDEAELAAVLGHEIGHVAARHHVKQALADAPLKPLRIATTIGGALTSIVAPRIGRTIAGTGQLASALVQAPYGRDQEREADRIGQALAASAGWDPDALTTIMATLGREQELHGGDADRTSFLATHPASAERSRAAHAHAASLVQAAAAPIAADSGDFVERLRGLLVGKSAEQGVFDGDEFLHPDLEIVWSIPAGWEQLNEDQFVGAVDREREASVVLLLAAEGDDPMAAAQASSREVRFEREPVALEISGLKAARGLARDHSRSNELSWIAHRGLVFLVNGSAPTENFESLHEGLRNAADSFRALTPEDRARIREARLDVARARQGETLSALLERSGSRWASDEAAVANGLLPDDRLDAGRRVKITRPVAVAE